LQHEERVLTVPRELTKSDREHCLPLSDFLLELLKRRRIFNGTSDWIFQSTRLNNRPISSGTGILHKVRAKSGIRFTFHDLRRTFLTMGEKLDVPTYALKRLVNHSVSNDMTGRYLVLDIERLRTYMTQISEAFIELLGVDDVLVKEWKPDDTSETSITVPT